MESDKMLIPFILTFLLTIWFSSLQTVLATKVIQWSTVMCIYTSAVELLPLIDQKIFYLCLKNVLSSVLNVWYYFYQIREKRHPDPYAKQGKWFSLLCLYLTTTIGSLFVLFTAVWEFSLSLSIISRSAWQLKLLSSVRSCINYNLFVVEHNQTAYQTLRMHASFAGRIECHRYCFCLYFKNLPGFIARHLLN